MQSGHEDTLEERYAIKFCFKLVPRKARFIPTFCKRINHTQPAVEIWVRAFEERKTNDLYVQQNLYTTTTTTGVLHQME